MPPSLNRRHLGTYPNLVTLLRPVCTGPFVWLCVQAESASATWARVGAVGLFGLIAATDLLDGWLARRLQQVSGLGRWLDHLCDVGFILTALGFFATRAVVPWWLPASIAWAFSLYVIKSWWWRAARPLPSLLGSRLGHVGGVLYFAAVGLVTVHHCTGGALLPTQGLQGVFMLLALLAFVSGGEHLMQVMRPRLRINPEAPTARMPTQSDCSAP
jgi:cardiolipin synthase (CMP-forming)